MPLRWDIAQRLCAQDGWACRPVVLGPPLASRTYVVGESSLRRTRQRNAKLTAVDVAIFLVVAAVVSAVAVPVIEKATRRAQQSTLLENLRVLREQIELYKLQHGGTPPVLHEGTFPQLIRATDPMGRLGPPGRKYPLGPYLRRGVPVNPVTGRSIVTLTDTFPPEAPSGNGGWLYHQPTGRIGIDLEEYLDR